MAESSVYFLCTKEWHVVHETMMFDLTGADMVIGQACKLMLF